MPTDTGERGDMTFDYDGLVPSPLIPNDPDEDDRGDEEQTTSREKRHTPPPPTLDPLVEMGLTDALFPGWRWVTAEQKKLLILAWAPTILTTQIPPGLDHKGFDQMKVMEPRDLLHRMSKTEFAMFLRQLGLTPERYIYGSAGNGTNVEHEIRIRITNADKTGMVEPPQDSLSDYLEALHTMLYENRHTFELRAPPQRTTLPSVDREGNFPSGDALSEYIAKSYALADGISQYSEFVCRTSYDRTGKPQRDNTVSG